MKLGILMEFCDRGTLKDAIFNPHLIYSLHSVLCWGEQLFAALAYVHSRNHLHRDIKPTNILVSGEDFCLKLGDFGSTKVLDCTSTTTTVTTRRYMSPPVILDESDDPDFVSFTKRLNSPKNDVYSMGLVLWELVERTIVFSDYGINSFEEHVFLFDYLTKKRTEIDTPDCKDELKDIIYSCTNFNYLNRQNAELIQLRLKDMREKLLDKFVLLPLVDENQHELLRPIGFDGTLNRVFVDLMLTLMELEPLSIATSKTDINPTEQQSSETQALRTTDSIPLEAQKAMGSKESVEAFRKLASSEKKQILQSLSQIVDDYRARSCFHTHIYNSDTHYYENAPGNPGDNEKTFYEWIRRSIQFELEEACRKFIFARPWLENSSVKRFSYRTYYKNLDEHLKELRRQRSQTDIKKINFMCYVLESTKEKWLLWHANCISEDCISEDPYIDIVNESFDEFRTYRGIFRDDTAARFVVKDPDAKEFSFFDEEYMADMTEEAKPRRNDCIRRIANDKDEAKRMEVLRFSHKQLVDTSIIRASLERQRAKLHSWVKLENEQLKPLGDFEGIRNKSFTGPVPGYFFQLRNPPRLPCMCEKKCEGKKLVPESFPVEMRIECYECASVESIEYLEQYFELCDRLTEAKHDPYYDKDNKALANFNFCFLQIHIKKAETLILLDQPDGYSDYDCERIPYFDRNWNFGTLDAALVAEYLTSKKLVKNSFINLSSILSHKNLF